MKPAMFDVVVRASRIPPVSKPVPESRECEVCPRTAWLLDVELKRGYIVKSFVCAHGHLKLVQERV